MELPYEERRSMIYRDLEKGDIVVGRINNIREYGFFLTLLCMAGGLKRDVEDLELSVGQQVKFVDKQHLDYETAVNAEELSCQLAMMDVPAICVLKMFSYLTE